MLSGDAGVFADPFYSPGADFIAFANGFITELICRDLSADHYRKYQNYFLTFYTNTLSLYRGQYGGFGDCNLMILKTIWDYTYYWGPLSKLFFSGRFTDAQFMEHAQEVLLEASALNSGMQRKFRARARSAQRVGGGGRFYDHHTLPIFHRIKNELLTGDSDGTQGQLRATVRNLASLTQTLDELMRKTDNGAEIAPLNELAHLPAFA